MTRRPRVLVMMTSTMTGEPRVRREARTLLDAGCEVIALGTVATGAEPRKETVDGLEIRRFDLLDVRIVRALKRLRGPGRGEATGEVSSAQADTPAAEAPGVDRVGDLREVLHHVASFFGFLWHGWRARADVYHPHDLPPLLAALVLGSLRRKPVVYESHEYWMAKHPDRPLTRRWTRFLEARGCRRAELVIVVNDTIADRMAEDYGIPRPVPVLNVPRVDPLPAVPDHDHSAPLEVLYHGILVPGRGIEHLIEAVALTSAPVRLVVRGPGPSRAALEQLAAALGVGDRCRFADPVPLDELIAAASASDVGVLPFEARLGYDVALPNKLFEYLAAGLAVVSSDLPELSRVIRLHDVGLTVPPGDVGALARALDKLAADRDALDASRARALDAATTSYTWARHERVLLDAYVPLISGRERS